MRAPRDLMIEPIRQLQASPSAARSQRGFLLVTAVTLIVVAALLIAVMVYFTATGSHSSAHNLSAKQALFIAGAGLERGTRTLLSPVLTERLNCGAISGDVNLTNFAFGAGQFTVTSGNGGVSYYSTAATALKGGINATDNTIPVNSLSGYANAGRVLIDRETIDYSDVEPTDTAICGGSARTPCLVGAQRGRDGTVAASHVSGTPVGQYQCDLQSQGGVPDLVNIRGKRTLQESVQLQEGWIVGDRINGGTGGWEFLRWNGTANPNAWVAQPVATPGTNAQRLRAMSMLNYADGWAVGDRNGNNFTLMHRVGVSWTPYPLAGTPANRANLYGVYCVASNDCWAVGDSNGTNFTFLQYNGAWSVQQLPATVATISNLRGVYCASTGDCWAVGDRNGNNFTFMRYSLGAWSAQPQAGTGATRANLSGVHCVSSNDCWAVGARSNGSNRWTLFHWDGAMWTRDASTASAGAQNLNSVTLTDSNNDGVADDGWAVGNRNGGGTNGWTFLRWNNPAANIWNPIAVNTPGAGAQNLNAVDCATANDCWAAGNGGMVLHWDGTGWSRVAIAGAGQVLRGIFMISHNQLPRAAWREVFP